MSARRSWQQFGVTLTGAFLTGHALQVRVSDYARVQRDLGEALERRPAEGWSYKPLEWQDIAGSYDGGGGYPSLVPLVLVRRDGDDLRDLVERAEEGRPAPEREWLRTVTRGWTWSLRSLTIELFDFGVGVIEGLYDVAAPTLLSAAETREVVDALSRLKADPDVGVRSPVAAAYEEVTLDTVRAFSTAVSEHAAHVRQEPWLTPLQAALWNGDGDATGDEQAASNAPRDDWGRLLWLHPVYLLSGRAWSSDRALRRLARPFQSSFTKAQALSDGVFMPGIDRSVIVARGAPARTRMTPLDLVMLHWAYYALFMEMDRGLLATLDSDKWRTSGSLGALEEDAERMFSVYMRVEETQARLNSVLADLGGGAIALWDAVADVSRFDELVAAVDGKVESLQRMAERRVQEAGVARARRTSNILGGLTALTVVTVVIALFGSLIGSRADDFGHVELRVATIAAAFVLALVLYLRQRELVRRRRRAWRAIRRRGTEA